MPQTRWLRRGASAGRLGGTAVAALHHSCGAGAGARGLERAAAYICWLDYAPVASNDAAANSMRMVRLRWARYGASTGPHYDVIDLGRVMYPVLLQRDPLKANTWWLNHYVAFYNSEP